MLADANVGGMSACGWAMTIEKGRKRARPRKLVTQGNSLRRCEAKSENENVSCEMYSLVLIFKYTRKSSVQYVCVCQNSSRFLEASGVLSLSGAHSLSSLSRAGENMASRCCCVRCNRRSVPNAH